MARRLQRPAAMEHVVALFRSNADAGAAIEALRAAGFAGDDVSVVMPNVGDVEEAAEGGGPAAHDVIPGAAIGGMLGGLAGWLVGIGALAIPGVGPFIAAGAFTAAMGGAGLGMALGGLAGALIDMGVPEHQADWYRREVEAGNTLVSVRAETRRAEAAEILRAHGSYDAASPAAAGAMDAPPLV